MKIPVSHRFGSKEVMANDATRDTAVGKSELLDHKKRISELIVLESVSKNCVRASLTFKLSGLVS